MTIPVSLKALVFDDQKAEKQFHTLLDVAEDFVDPSWIRDPLTGRESSQTIAYTTGWRSASQVQSHQRMQAERHVMLTVDVARNQPLHVVNYGFEATHLSETDWGIFLRLTADDGPAEPRYAIRFFHPQFNATDHAGQTSVLDWPNTSLNLSTRERDQEYMLSVWLAQTEQDRSVQTWRSHIDSPEVFRDELLSAHEQLRGEVPKRIAAGEVLHTNWSTARSNKPPVIRDSPLGVAPPAPIAAKLTALANQEIDRRRQLIEQHYRDIHAALLSVFRLQEALGQQSPSSENNSDSQPDSGVQ